MKKLFGLMVVLFLSVPFTVSAQAVVELGALTQTIMEKTRLEQVLYYVQMVEQQILAVTNTYNQFEAAIRAEQRAIENLKGIANVNSYDDFMDWYNGQLSMERNAQDRFSAIEVTVGKESYPLSEIDKIPEGVNNTFGDKYRDDFTPQQRRDMRLNLGLTPSNYVYQSAWAAKEKELAAQIMTNSDTTNEDNQAAYERNGKILEEASKGEVAEKAVLQGLLDILADTNRAIRQANYDEAVFREYQRSRDQLNKTAPNPPELSERWNRELFGSITGEQRGRYIDY